MCDGSPKYTGRQKQEQPLPTAAAAEDSDRFCSRRTNEDDDHVRMQTYSALARWSVFVLVAVSVDDFPFSLDRNFPNIRHGAVAGERMCESFPTSTHTHKDTCGNSIAPLLLLLVESQ